MSARHERWARDGSIVCMYACRQRVSTEGHTYKNTVCRQVEPSITILSMNSAMHVQYALAAVKKLPAESRVKKRVKTVVVGFIRRSR